MKRLILSLLFILPSTAWAQVPATKLMALGMPAALATEVASIGTGSAALNNNTYLKSRNAANNANLDLLKADGSNNTELNGPSGGAINLAINGSAISELSATQIRTFVDQNFSTGKTIGIQEATAATACSGSLTFNGTTPVVTTTTCATTGSRIFLTPTSDPTGATAAYCWISAISTGVSFSVDCDQANDGTANWMIVHEAP